MKTARMTVLVTPDQKATILNRAERLGLSAGEMLRRAVESYQPSAANSAEDEAVLNALADELFAAARSARKALGEANREIKTTLKQLAKSREAANGRI
jgi:hypothetical protein